MKSPIQPEAFITFHNKLTDEAFKAKLKQDSSAALADCGIILDSDVKVNFYEEGEVVPPNTDKVLNITLPSPTELAQLSEQQLDNVSAGIGLGAILGGMAAIGGGIAAAASAYSANKSGIGELETKAKNVINYWGERLNLGKLL